jgi:hypothetical protein
MLLGFVVSERGIEANSEKILAIMDMADQEPEGCAACHGLPRISKSLRRTTRRTQPTIVQTYEEVRPLHVDPRGARGT